MELPKFKTTQAYRQSSFSDWAHKPLHSRQQATTAVGDFFEEAIKVVFGADRFKINGNCKCPDLLHEDTLIESKAFGHSGSTIISIDQLFTYKELAIKFDYDFYYIFAIHGVKKVSAPQTVEGLKDILAENILGFYVLHWEKVWKLSKGKKIGRYETPKHKPFCFYRLNWNNIRDAGRYKTKELDAFKVYGRQVLSGVQLYEEKSNSKILF